MYVQMRQAFAHCRVRRKTGFPVPPGDIAALANRLAMPVRDTDLRAKIARACRGKGRSFSWDKILGQLPEHYQDVLRSKGGYNTRKQGS